jgi:sugar lactone lactonase YvrE
LPEDDGRLSVFRSPSMNSNGNTTDRQGRLVSCEHGGRRVVRTEFDGTITVVADRYNGKRLNSPNDVVVDNLAVARAAYDTAVALWPTTVIELRQKATVILNSRGG